MKGYGQKHAVNTGTFDYHCTFDYQNTCTAVVKVCEK